MTQPRWLVQLIGETGDLSYLAAWFPDGPCHVVLEQDVYYLAGDDFEALERPEEVRERAEAALDKIACAAKLILGVFARPRIGIVYRDEGNGRRHATMFGATLNAVVRVVLEVQLTPPGRPTYAQELVTTSNQSPGLATAMLLWADDLRTWPRLYRTLEEIEDGIGTSVSKAGLCSDNERERFKQSANSPVVAGRDARHSARTVAPPKKPMTIHEAERFLRRLLVGALEFVKARSSAQ